MTAPDWQLALLKTSLGAVDPAFEVELVQSIDSTNSELMRRAHAGTHRSTLLVAQTQTAGRGRLGRQWQSALQDEAGASLTFSLGMRLPARDLSGLSLAVGASLAQSLDAVGTLQDAAQGAAQDAPLGPAKIGLKWPNDLWWQERKLAGVLVETVACDGALQVVVGVGVNILAPRPAHFATAAAALDEIHPGVGAPHALGLLAAPLAQTMRRFAQEGFAPFKAAFEARDLLLGREVMGLPADGEGAEPLWIGRACGVDAGGALLVHTAQGMQRITSSDVRIRPAGGPVAARPV